MSSDWIAMTALWVSVMAAPAYLAYHHPEEYPKVGGFFAMGVIYVAGAVLIGDWRLTEGAQRMAEFAGLTDDQVAAFLKTRPNGWPIYALFGLTFFVLIMLAGLKDLGLTKQGKKPASDGD